MAYGQKYYQEKLGNSNWTLAEAGCFVTGFCNLLLDIGQEVDPPTLDNFFRDNGVFTYDASDRANDDLYWNSVSRFNGNIVVDHIGGAGWPDSNFAIVKFCYKSPRYGNMVTHFCKVADWQNHLILDSYDGVVRAPGYYGEPVAFAVYRNDTPPPAPPAAPAPPIEVIPAPQAKPANIVYTKLDTPLALVTNKQPTNKWDLGFENDTQVTSVAVLQQGIAFTAYGKGQRTDRDKPCYYMTAEDFGNADTTGVPNSNSGINTVDLSLAPTPEVPSVPVPPSPPIAPDTATPAVNPEDGEKVKVTVDPNGWQHSFVNFLTPQKFVANTTLAVHDIADTEPDVELLKGQVITIAGTFTRDGVKYYRSAKSVADNKWYGIAVVALTKMTNIADDAENEVDRMLDEIRTELEPIVKHGNAIAKAATANGLLQRIFHRNKNK